MSRYSPEDRDREKQRSRDADAEALASGQKTGDELRLENAFVPTHLARQPLDFAAVPSVRSIRVS